MSQDAPRVDPSVAPGAKPAPFPGFLEPCHPTLRQEPPSGGSWVHEIKFDGYRTQAHLRNGEPAIYTRRGYDWTLRFRSIDAVAALPAKDLILDGEAVVVDSRGIPDFGLLHADLAGGRKDRLLYYRRPGHPSTARMTPPGPSGSHADPRCWQRQDRGRSATPPRACSGCRLALATRMDSSASLVASVMIRSADERV
jgi:ATP dependent DNA ligase domain